MPLNLSVGDLLAFVGIPAATGLASTLISNSAANNAVNAQTQANTQASALQAQTARDALGFQQQVYNDQLQLSLPAWQRGEVAGQNLSRLTGMGGPVQTPQFRSNVQPVNTATGAAGITNYAPNYPQQPQQGGGGGLRTAANIAGLGATGLGIANTFGLFGGGAGAGALSGLGGALGGAIPLGSSTITAAGSVVPTIPGMTIGGVGGGGGLGGAITGLATNPWTLPVAGALAGGAAWLKSQAHHEANWLGENLERPFTSSVVNIHDSFFRDAGNGTLTYDQAVMMRNALAQNWTQFKQRLQEYSGKGSDEQRVAGQALSGIQKNWGQDLSTITSQMDQVIARLAPQQQTQQPMTMQAPTATNTNFMSQLDQVASKYMPQRAF